MTTKVLWFLLVTMNGHEAPSMMFSTEAECREVLRYWQRTEAVTARCTNDQHLVLKGLE